MIANSHIDPVWLWDKYEGIDEVINTFKSACDRLDEYPDLKFTASSISFYKWVEICAPEVFERIKLHVALGRWEIVGGWLVEADCNLPITESFINSAKISREFTLDRFGIQSEVAYSPDTFGHPASMPTMLTDTGFKYYIFSRPSMQEKPDLPGNLFYWEHHGKRVLCQRLKYHYSQGSGWTPESINNVFADEGLYYEELGCYFFGVGDHGGGPTKAEVDFLNNRKLESEGPELKFSTCLDYFHEAEMLPDIPTYSGDLHFHAVGCYSVNRALKNAVRNAERRICSTKRILDIAGQDDSGLEHLWEKTVFNQFHDIMPGSSAPEPYKEAIEELGGVNDECSGISYSAMKQISSEIKSNCVQGEFRILNSLDHAVTGPFEMESFMYYRPGSAFRNQDGKELAIQEITPSVYCANRRWLFIDTIPAKTMNRYYFDAEGDPKVGYGSGFEYSAGESISIEDLKVDAPGIFGNSKTGGFLTAPITLAVIRDSSDTWSHGVKGYAESEDRFVPTSCTVKQGQIVSYLLSRQSFGRSTAELKFSIYKDLPYIDLDIKIHWTEEQSILKLDIAPDGGIGKLFAQCPGTYVEKKTIGCEEPMHGWLLAGNLGIVQDGAFAYDRIGDVLRLTLVRSSLFGYDQGWTIDRNGPVSNTDQGEHSFRFRFFKCENLIPEKMDALLASFIEPFRVMRENR